MADATAVQQVHPEFETSRFLPMSGSEFVRPPTTETSASREVPPPADDARLGETHQADAGSSRMEHGMLDTGYESERPGYTEGQEISGMEIDVIDAPHSDLNELMDVLTRDDRDAVREANDEIMNVVRALGGSDRKFKRHRDRALQAVVSEIYSPPRVTAAAKLLSELRVIPGFALDLTTADEDGSLWDFDSKVMRDRAMARVWSERPLLLTSSPQPSQPGRG